MVFCHRSGRLPGRGCLLIRAPSPGALMTFYEAINFLLNQKPDRLLEGPSHLPILELKDIHLHFGGIMALNGVGFDVREINI